MTLVHVTGGQVIEASSIILAIDWGFGKDSPDNRELVAYARAHGFLVDKGFGPGVLIVTSDKVYLLPGSLRSLMQRLKQT